MNFRSTRVCPRHPLRLSAVFALASAPAFACSHDFEISYLFSTESELLAAPEGTFSDEVIRLTAVRGVMQRAVPTAPKERHYRMETDPRPTTAAQDIADLRSALE